MANIPQVACIYKITSPSGKIYIGQTNNFSVRYSHYKTLHCKGQVHLYNSLVKHGFDSHTFEILHELPFDASQEVVNNYEDFYLKHFKELGFKVLNIREAGSNGRLAAVTKDKISKSRVEYYKANPDKAKQAYAIIKTASDKWRNDNPEIFRENVQKMKEWYKDEDKAKEIYKRIAVKTKQWYIENPEKRDEIIAKSVEARKGKPLSNLHREKLSKAGKGRVVTDEHRKNLSLSLKGKPKKYKIEDTIAQSIRAKKIGGWNKKAIIQLSLSGEFIREWESGTAAAKHLGVSRKGIERCLKKKRGGKTFGGYLWKYK